MLLRILQESALPPTNADILGALVPRWLVQTIIIMGVTRSLSMLGSWFKQPRVIFEIIGGILLGPSALGRNQHFLERCFPKSTLSYLQIVAEVGLILYLFLVGLELDPEMLLNNFKKTGSIAIVGMIIPFGLGVAICPTLYHVLIQSDPHTDHVNFTSFFVFIGTSMSITAFPVLARILKEGGLIYSKAGATAMGAAAIGDAIAWCLLILAISIANATTMTVALWVFLTTVAAACGLFFVFRPFYVRVVTYVEDSGNATMEQNLFSFTIILVFFCAWCTSIIGVHSIFGAFMFGLIIPRNSRLFSSCEHNIEQFVLTICLPIYFALSGLKTDITQLKTADDGAMLVLVCFIATIGKFIGAGVPSYISGMSIRQSCTVAVLMNTRGLVELIVLNLGVESGILNIKVFTVMVLMAVFTTFLTCPLVELVFPPARREKERERERLAKLQLSGDEHHTASTATDIALAREKSKMIRETPEKHSDFRFSVAVTYLEQIPDLMNLIYSFAPASKTQTNSLHLSLLRCVPPTHTSKDRYLGFDSTGELLEVTNESSNIHHYVHTLNHLDTKHPPPDLFPLSIFCNTIGVDTEIKRMIGDPTAFPHSIQKLTALHMSELLIIPWKSTEFLDNFVTTNIIENDIPIGVLTTIDLESNNNDLPTPGRKGRSFSFGGSTNNMNNNSNDLSGIDNGNGIEMADVSLTPGPNITPIAAGHGRSIHNIGVIFTGNSTDELILSLIYRIQVNSSIEIKVFLPLNYSYWKDSLKNAVDTFVDKEKKMLNVSIINLPILQVEFSKIAESVAGHQFDLIICSFVELPEEPVIDPKTEEEFQPPMIRQRSDSIGDMITDAVGRLAGFTSQSHLETRDQLMKPELGSIGSHIHHLLPSSYTLVLHPIRNITPPQSETKLTS